MLLFLFFSMIKSMDDADKFNLTEVYKKLTRIEVDMVGVDLKYSEGAEAKFIKDFLLVVAGG